jgi:hypothetical protein
MLRDSANPGVVVECTRASWLAFREAIQTREFDDLD